MDDKKLEELIFWSAKKREHGEEIANVILDMFYELRKYHKFDILISYTLISAAIDIAYADEGNLGLTSMKERFERDIHFLKQTVQRGDLPPSSNDDMPEHLRY